MSTLKMNPATIKKAGKELEGIIEPETKDGEPISLSEGKVKDLKSKIIEAAELLTGEDEISDTLRFVLGEYGVKIGEEDVIETDEPDEEQEVKSEKKEDEQGHEVWTYEQLNKLPRKKLEKVALKLSNPLDLDDYKEKKDLLLAVCDVMGLSDKEEMKAPKKGKESVETDVIEKEKPPKVKKETPKQEKKAPAKVIKKGYNRGMSVSECIKKMAKKGFTIPELQKASDTLYCKETGNNGFDYESNKMHPATHIVNYMLHGLVEFAILEKNENTFTFI